MKKNNTAYADKGQKSSRGLAGLSLIVYLLDKLSDVIYNAFINGFFGYIFTAYSSELTSYKDGYIVSYFKGGSKTRKVLRKIREFLSGNFESSFILRKLRKAVLGLAFVPLKIYGSFFLSFGIYTLLVYFINMLLPITGTANSSYLYIGIGICIAAMPMYFSSQTLAGAVKNSRITSAVFVDAFGYREESFDNSEKSAHHTRSGFSVLAGLVAGVLTFVLHPMWIVGVIFAFTLISLIIITPEIGVLLCLFLLPFLSFTSNPTMLLTALVLITMFSYVIKLVRGKRVFKLELVDLVVAFFFVIMLFSGAITTGGRSSYYSALVSCFLMFGYFLVVNLIRTEKWLHRCILTLVSSGTVVAFIGVIQYIIGASPNNWMDTGYFPDISGRSTSLFENPNYLAAYLALIFPFALYQTIVCKTGKSRFLGIISCLSIVLCTVFTWCRGAWIAMLICALVFFLIYSRKTMRIIYLALLSIPFLPFVLPKNVVSRFLSIGDMADSSTLYRVYTWRGSADMAKEYFWGGIGYGTDAFRNIYPEFAYAGIESAAHSHSLYLQILIGMGIGGVICFGLIIFFYMQKSFEYLKKPYSDDSFIITAAALTAFVSLLIMGLFDYVWYNYRIFFLFWIVMALGVACIRIGKSEATRAYVHQDNTDTCASAEIVF